MSIESGTHPFRADPTHATQVVDTGDCSALAALCLDPSYKGGMNELGTHGADIQYPTNISVCISVYTCPSRLRASCGTSFCGLPKVPLQGIPSRRFCGAQKAGVFPATVEHSDRTVLCASQKAVAFPTAEHPYSTVFYAPQKQVLAAP